MPSDKHITTLQRHDHARMEKLLRSYERASAHARPLVYGEIIDLVTKHAFAEEAALFPAARRYLREADPLTGDIEQKHQQVNDLIVEMEHSQPGEAAFEERAARVFALLRADAREEEDQLLVALSRVASEHELRELGSAWLAARKIAPNRAHPRISRRPPWNWLAAMPLAIIDRVARLLGQTNQSATQRA
jgi:hypothetical protein